MQYIEFKEQLRGFTTFSLSDIKGLDAKFHRRRLNDWQAKGYIKKLIKGYYIFSDLRLDERSMFEIANRIYPPSYVSFEMALSYYGFIPESVYGITSASSRRTYAFKTPVAEFTYRTIAPRLFFGYDIIAYGNKSFKIAAAEKAVLDYFYNNPNIRNKDDFVSLRINKKAFLKIINENKLRRYLARFAKKPLTKRVKLFLEFIKHA